MSDFIIQQGTDSGIEWPVYTSGNLPMNFTGWTGETQIRAINTDRLIHTFSTANGDMILGIGKVTLIWTSEITSSWNWKQAKFGIEVTNSQGKKARLKQDIVTLSKEVTK